jgi:hypothetical protein
MTTITTRELTYDEQGRISKETVTVKEINDNVFPAYPVYPTYPTWPWQITATY